MLSEIHQDPQFQTRSMQITDYLCTMSVDQLRYSFDFHDDFAKADEVWFVFVTQRFSAISQVEFRLGNKGNSLKLQFYLKTLLVHRFQKTAALLVVDLKTSANNSVTFLWVEQLCHVLAPFLIFPRPFTGFLVRQQTGQEEGAREWRESFRLTFQASIPFDFNWPSKPRYD